jgi:hypothetical protein
MTTEVPWQVRTAIKHAERAERKRAGAEEHERRVARHAEKVARHSSTDPVVHAEREARAELPVYLRCACGQSAISPRYGKTTFGDSGHGQDRCTYRVRSHDEER